MDYIKDFVILDLFEYRKGGIGFVPVQGTATNLICAMSRRTSHSKCAGGGKV